MYTTDYIKVISGMKGKFIVGQPFDKHIDPDTIYTVSSILALNEIVTSDLDPLENVYKVNGLTEDEFDYDLQNNIDLVSLTTEDKANSFIYIPMRYIRSAPMQSHAVYQSHTFLFSLAALPEYVDKNVVGEEVRDFIKARLGIDAKFEMVNNSDELAVPNEKHEIIEAKRLTMITEGTYLTELRKLRLLVEKLKKENQALKCHIKNS